MGLLDAISPTPRNRIIGLLADATQGVNDFASKPFGYDNPPARMLMGLLGVPSIATTLDRLSYGEPLTNAGKANVPLLKPETADAAMAAAAALPAVSRGALKASDAAVRAITRNPQATATRVADYAAQMAPQRGLLSAVEDARTPSMTARDYMIDHRPMQIEGGASPLHDLIPAFGEDIYGSNALQYFGSGDPREKFVLQVMKKVKGNPDAKVTIYRGVPDGVEQAINRGDWVTLDPRVAADYGNVVKMEVPASHITSWADSLLEQGYWPPVK